MEYAILLYLIVAREAIKRYWPIAVGIVAIFGLGFVVGSVF